MIRLVFDLGGGKSAFKAVCTNFKAAVANHDIYPFDHDDFVQALFTARPLQALESFLGGDDDDLAYGLSIIGNEIRHRKGPLASAAVGDLIIWCERDPARRYPVIADIVPLFKKDDTSDWSEHAREVLHRAPDKVVVLKRLVERFRPSSWSGSLASILETRLPLLRRLESDSDPVIAQLAREQIPLLVDEIERARAWETKMDRDRDERFE